MFEKVGQGAEIIYLAQRGKGPKGHIPDSGVPNKGRIIEEDWRDELVGDEDSKPWRPDPNFVDLPEGGKGCDDLISSHQ